MSQVFLGFCVLWKQNVHLDTSGTYAIAGSSRGGGGTVTLTLLDLLLLLFNLIGYNCQLGLKLGRCCVGSGKVVQRLPGALKRADESLLQVSAHPGETLLQLWKTQNTCPNKASAIPTYVCLYPTCASSYFAHHLCRYLLWNHHISKFSESEIEFCWHFMSCWFTESLLVPTNQNKVVLVFTSNEFTKGWFAPYRDEASSFLCGVELKLASGPRLVISRAQSGTPQGPAGTTGGTLDNNTLALQQQDSGRLDLDALPVYETQTRQEYG